MTRRTTNESRSPRDALAGCRRRAELRMQRTDSASAKSEARIDLPPMPDVKYVSAYTHPYGMNYVKVEAVSLVTGLSGTGSDPPPTPQRAAAARRNETSRRGESQRGARVRRTRRWFWCGHFCDPAFRKAIASTSKFAFRPGAKPRACATVGCFRRG